MKENFSKKKPRVMLLDDSSEEEAMKGSGRSFINGPRFYCEVCGRHISELKPFEGPDDPEIGDFFSGVFLVKNYRAHYLSVPDADRVWVEAEEAIPNEEGDLLPWFISKYGEEQGERRFKDEFKDEFCFLSSSWECKDCIELEYDQYFQKKASRSSQEQ